MTAGAQASPLNRLAANLEELGLGAMAPVVPDYVRLVADGEKDLVTALLEITDAQLAAKRRADEDRRVLNLPRFRLHPYAAVLAAPSICLASNSSGLRCPSAEWIRTRL